MCQRLTWIRFSIEPFPYKFNIKYVKDTIVFSKLLALVFKPTTLFWPNFHQTFFGQHKYTIHLYVNLKKKDYYCSQK